MKKPRLNLNASAAHTWTECTAQPHYILENAHRIADDFYTYRATAGIALCFNQQPQRIHERGRAVERDEAVNLVPFASATKLKP